MLDTPASVAETTRTWRGQADLIGRFFDEAIELDENSAVLSREFYEVFRGWCVASGHRPWSDQLLWDRMKVHEKTTSGAVEKSNGAVRLDGRTFSSAVSTKAPTGKTARLVTGVKFAEGTGVYTLK